MRDTADARWLTTYARERLPAKREPVDDLVGSKFRLYLELGGADTVLGLDLNWFFTPEPFLSHASVRQVVSLWFDDLRTTCVRLQALVPRDRSFQESIRHPSLTHCFYGEQQRFEASLLGFPNTRLSRLAAPAEYLSADAPLRFPRRLAFVGGPGGLTPPSPAAAALLEARAEIADFRLAALQESLADAAAVAWASVEPTVRPWLEMAADAKRLDPSRPALSLLIDAGRHYPRAIEYLNTLGAILDAALLVKLVLRYDRPALVHRFWSRGLVDVFSNPWHWSKFGIDARPTVTFDQLPNTYRAYAGQLNAGYSARECSANEKLYEIAACGRLSFNLAGPDVAAAYAPDEAAQGSTFAEIEDQVRHYLAHPGDLAEAGERARARTTRDHTWDIRLGQLFAPAPTTTRIEVRHRPIAFSTDLATVRRPRAALFLSNDLSYAFTKTTEYLAAAATRLGVLAVTRDSYDPRAVWTVVEAAGDEASVEPAERDIAERCRTMIDDFGIQAVLSLDLGWLFLPDLFLDHPGIRRIYSLWFDDFHSWCRAPTNTFFPCRARSFQEILRDPRVRHCFYGEGLSGEALALGYPNQLHSPLAAPAEYLSVDHPCTIRDRIAFVGNPGFRAKPSRQALDLLDSGAELPTLREYSRAEVLATLRNQAPPWATAHPQIIDLIAFATAAKARSPYVAAVQILQLCAPGFPEAYDALNRSGHALDAAHLIRLVNRFDRPALVRRLHRAGLCDVISNPLEWEPWGVPAGESVFADSLPAVYQRYVGHVNAANPLRDAPANEKLFEIAACGRASINLWSPDVGACYDDGEVFFADSLEAAEHAARALLSDPDRALAAGARARTRTERDHTWDRRLAAIWAADFPPANSTLV